MFWVRISVTNKNDTEKKQSFVLSFCCWNSVTLVLDVSLVSFKLEQEIFSAFSSFFDLNTVCFTSNFKSVTTNAGNPRGKTMF